MSEKPNPATVGVLQAEQQPAVRICRDVYDGTLRMRERGTEYLPKFPRESGNKYLARKETAVLFNGMARAVGAFAGMVMRKPLKLDGIPDDILQQFQDIDQSGRDLGAYTVDTLTDELIDGHRVILVDMDPAPQGARNRKEEGDRWPFWVDIPHQAILRFEASGRGDSRRVLRFAYRFDLVVPGDDEFSDKKTVGVRDYGFNEAGVVEWREWHKHPDKEETDADAWEQVEGGKLEGHMASRIPIAVAYASRGGVLQSRPPMLDLAIENVRHYQLRSDRDHHLHIASVPIPVLIGGFDDEELEVSSDEGIRLPQGGDAKMLESSGAALAASRQELIDTENRMAALAIAMLQHDTRAAETAEAKRIDKAENDASLSTAADGLENALNEALELHYMWLGRDLGDARISVNRDFERQMLDPAMAKVLLDSVVSGNLSPLTFWETLARGEVLPEGFDPDEEEKRLAKERNSEELGLARAA